MIESKIEQEFIGYIGGVRISDKQVYHTSEYLLSVFYNVTGIEEDQKLNKFLISDIDRTLFKSENLHLGEFEGEFVEMIKDLNRMGQVPRYWTDFDRYLKNTIDRMIELVGRRNITREGVVVNVERSNGDNYLSFKIKFDGDNILVTEEDNCSVADREERTVRDESGKLDRIEQVIRVQRD